MGEFTKGSAIRFKGREDYPGEPKGLTVGQLYRIIGRLGGALVIVDDFGHENAGIAEWFDQADLADPAVAKEILAREEWLRTSRPGLSIWNELDAAIKAYAEYVEMERAEAEAEAESARVREEVSDAAPGDDSRWDEI